MRSRARRCTGDSCTTGGPGVTFLSLIPDRRPRGSSVTAPLPRAPSQPAAPGAPSPVSVQGHQPLVRDVLPGIVDASPVPVALFRTDRTVAYRNDAWLALFGEAGLDAEPDQVDPIARTLADGTGSVALERHVRRADGGQLPILLDVTPVVDDRSTVIGAVAFAEPLDRVAASTLRDAFIGVLSHELRTPITSIYGGSQLLLHDDLSAEFADRGPGRHRLRGGTTPPARRGFPRRGAGRARGEPARARTAVDGATGAPGPHGRDPPFGLATIRRPHRAGPAAGRRRRRADRPGASKPRGECRHDQRTAARPSPSRSSDRTMPSRRG